MHNQYDEELVIGDRIAGRYEILSILGQGSMGVVYKCRHDILGRVVAIKTLRIQRNADDRSQMRFEREARAASRLEHSNLITVHDFGYTAQGVPYLVMDFVSGTPLYDILKRERCLLAERVVNLFAEVCDGLYHAHQRGVIHRDLKPANILVVPRENMPETVKIVDLGVAKIVHGAEEESEAITRTGEVCGSPIYLSPEQCMYQELDARTDIYSLGVCLYESLAGIAPIRGATVYDTIYMHVHDAPKPFSPELKLPKKLEDVVMRCLAKNPNDRYETMLQLKSELLSSLRTGPETSPVNVLPPDALFSPPLNRTGESRKRSTAEMKAVDANDKKDATPSDSSRRGAERTGQQPLVRPPDARHPERSEARESESARHANNPSGQFVRAPMSAGTELEESDEIRIPGTSRSVQPGAAKSKPAAKSDKLAELTAPKKTSESKKTSEKGKPLRKATEKAGDKEGKTGPDISAESSARMRLILCLSLASILIGLGLGLGFAVFITNDKKETQATKHAGDTTSGGGVGSFDDPIASVTQTKNSAAAIKAVGKKNGVVGSKKQTKVPPGKSLLSMTNTASNGRTKSLESYLDGPSPNLPKDGSAGKYFSIVQQAPSPQHNGQFERMMAPGGQANMVGGGRGPGGRIIPQHGNTANTKLQQQIMRWQQDPRFQQAKQLIASQTGLGPAAGAGQAPGPGLGIPGLPGMSGGAQGGNPLANFIPGLGAGNRNNNKQINNNLNSGLMPIAGPNSGGNQTQRGGPLEDFQGGADQAQELFKEGFQLYGGGNFEPACRKFEQARKMDPSNAGYRGAHAQALNAYASSLNKQQKYAEAVHVVKKAIELAPDKSLYHDNLYKFEQNLENQRTGSLNP